MNVFICLDDQGGMLFNHRRQSRDEAVLRDMLAAADGKIWMNTYSSGLFRPAGSLVPSAANVSRSQASFYAVPDRIIIKEDVPECVPEHGWCFLENIPLKPHEDKIETITAYFWNRVYPADTCLDLDLSQGWETIDTKEFGGTSHEKITRKIYRRKNR